MVQTSRFIDYVGIATVWGQPGYRAPVYPQPRPRGNPIGYLDAGQYAPHFTALIDRSWLEVTLMDGERGWLKNDPFHVFVTEPDPSRLRLCIDPGHGGSDTGAVGNGLVEKDLNLDIGYWHLRPRLESDGRIDRVWMTRTGDYDVSLAYRADLASASGANLFVSLHNNAHLISSRGTETYYKCGSEATEAVRIQSKRAACLVHSRVQEAIMQFGSPSCPWFDRGVICRMISLSDPRSYYYVIRNSTVPTLLVEFLFVSNPNEALCLGNHTFRDMMAEAVYSGITDALFTDLPGDSCNFKTYYGL
ncbi:MAG: N-acetylmuramoyl-L-alanine amidase family protein [Bacillota bacterium]